MPNCARTYNPTATSLTFVDPSLHARVLTDEEVRQEIALLEMRMKERGPQFYVDMEAVFLLMLPMICKVGIYSALVSNKTFKLS